MILENSTDLFLHRLLSGAGFIRKFTFIHLNLSKIVRQGVEQLNKHQ